MRAGKVYLSVAPKAGLDLSWIRPRGAGAVTQSSTTGRPEAFALPLHFETCYEDRKALLATGVDDHLINSEEGVDSTLF